VGSAPPVFCQSSEPGNHWRADSGLDRGYDGSQGAGPATSPARVGERGGLRECGRGRFRSREACSRTRNDAKTRPICDPQSKSGTYEKCPGPGCEVCKSSRHSHRFSSRLSSVHERWLERGRFNDCPAGPGFHFALLNLRLTAKAIFLGSRIEDFATGRVVLGVIIRTVPACE
jgi:hypothetical protein